jgi:Skp family chaperone for outer membrane proteins
MGIDIIIFVAIGLAILIGFLKQFGVLSGKGLLFTIAGVSAVFGVSIFLNARKSRIKREIKEREGKLKKQEKKVKEMMDEYQETRGELAVLNTEIERARLDAARRLAEIEAEKEVGIEAAIERANTMTTEDLLNQLSAFAEGN